jgi:hypothetical protein
MAINPIIMMIMGSIFFMFGEGWPHPPAHQLIKYEEWGRINNKPIDCGPSSGS